MLLLVFSWYLFDLCLVTMPALRPRATQKPTQDKTQNQHKAIFRSAHLFAFAIEDDAYGVEQYFYIQT